MHVATFLGELSGGEVLPPSQTIVGSFGQKARVTRATRTSVDAVSFHRSSYTNSHMFSIPPLSMHSVQVVSVLFKFSLALLFLFTCPVHRLDSVA